MSSSSQDRPFDKLSFVRYMKNIGRAYRKQAMELVTLCRTFVQAHEQTPDSDAKLRSALQAVDDALSSAADVKKKTSKEVDEKFESAIEVLSRYEMECYPKKPVSRDGGPMTVHERMMKAKTKDKSSSTILNRLKEKLSVKATEDEQQEPTTIVEFILLKSLPDKNPIVVKQVLGQRSTLPEILWNFSRFKDARRLTLKENPHFYKFTDLPASPEAYIGDFKSDPIDNFQHAKICVLTDKPGRVYLETDQNTRAFGNVWVPNEAIIFKDVCGKLEGENIVQASIQGAPDMWYLEEPPLSPTDPHLVSPNQSSPLPTMAAFSANSVAEGPFQDWREPIRQGLISPHTSIRIKASSPNNPSPGSPISPFATHSNRSNACDDSSLSMLRIPTYSSTHHPHRSVRRLVASQRPLLSKASPDRTAPPSQVIPPRTSSQQPPIVTLPPKDQPTPTPALATPIASTPRDASQIRELQDCVVTGEVFLQKSDVRRSIHLTVTVTSPPEETSPHILHMGGGEAEACRNNPDQANIRGSEQKGAARLAPYSGSKPALSQTQGLVGRVQKTAAWQFWSQICNQAFQK